MWETVKLTGSWLHFSANKRASRKDPQHVRAHTAPSKGAHVVTAVNSRVKGKYSFELDDCKATYRCSSIMLHNQLCSLAAGGDSLATPSRSMY